MPLLFTNVSSQLSQGQDNQPKVINTFIHSKGFRLPSSSQVTGTNCEQKQQEESSDSKNTHFAKEKAVKIRRCLDSGKKEGGKEELHLFHSLAHGHAGGY